MEIAIEVPDYSGLKLIKSRGEWPPPPTSWPIGGREEGLTRWWGSKEVTWGERGSKQFYWDAHRRQTWTSHVVLDAWQHWLYKPSRQETDVSVVHWYSVTGRLLWRSLKQPSVPLAGILYEKIESCKWNHRRRDLWYVTHRLTKIKADRNLEAVKLDSVLSYTESGVLVGSGVRSQTQPSSLLSLWAVWLCGESDSAIFFAESLSLVCGEPDSAIFFCWVPELCEEPDSSSAEFLSCVFVSQTQLSSAESVCCT